MKGILLVLLVLGLNSLNAVTLERSNYYGKFPKNDIRIHYEKDKGECHPAYRPEDAKDWIAIYKKGTSSAWKNVIKWAWVKDLHGYAPCDEDHIYPNVKKGLENGIGLVKLMGRDSGFIAAKATLANDSPRPNVCLTEGATGHSTHSGPIPQTRKAAPCRISKKPGWDSDAAAVSISTNMKVVAATVCFRIILGQVDVGQWSIEVRVQGDFLQL